jgi:hypothetical protein
MATDVTWVVPLLIKPKKKGTVRFLSEGFQRVK